MIPSIYTELKEAKTKKAMQRIAESQLATFSDISKEDVVSLSFSAFLITGPSAHALTLALTNVGGSVSDAFKTAEHFIECPRDILVEYFGHGDTCMTRPRGMCISVLGSPEKGMITFLLNPSCGPIKYQLLWGDTARFTPIHYSKRSRHYYLRRVVKNIFELCPPTENPYAVATGGPFSTEHTNAYAKGLK